MTSSSIIQAFSTVFPAELPDKTMVATVVLVARYRRPLWVWVGVVGAFTLHVVIAVVAGTAVGLLPAVAVKSIVTLLFLVGGVFLLHEARKGTDEAIDEEVAVGASIRSTVVGSFGLVLHAEWGDLTQLATACLAAKSGDPLGIGIGALAALASVAAIASMFGRQLVARVALHKINYVGAAVFLALAALTFVELLRAL